MNKLLNRIYEIFNEGAEFDIYTLIKEIENGTFNDDSLEPKLSDEQIIEKCTELGMYDDDDFTPPECVNELSDNEDLWDWIQGLLKASAINALDMQDDNLEKVENIEYELNFDNVIIETDLEVDGYEKTLDLPVENLEQENGALLRSVRWHDQRIEELEQQSKDYKQWFEQALKNVRSKDNEIESLQQENERLKLDLFRARNQNWK